MVDNIMKNITLEKHLVEYKKTNRNENRRGRHTLLGFSCSGLGRHSVDGVTTCLSNIAKS